MGQTILLIDANNLAHRLFALPQGCTLTSELDRRLILTLEDWLHRYETTDRFQVELVFDSDPESTAATTQLRVLYASPGEDADFVIRERLNFHHYRGSPVLLISEDEELRIFAEELGGTSLPASHFVQLSGPRHFRLFPPETIPQPKKPGKGLSAQDTTEENHFSLAKQKQDSTKKKEKWYQREAEWEQINIPRPKPEPAKEPSYSLTIDQWDRQEGARFLIQSFCNHHRALVDDLLSSADREDLTFEALLSLAQLLVEQCGTEPDFCRRGSIMNRVRLALLIRSPQTVSFSDLVSLTGLNPNGLKQTIRKKAKYWLEIISED